MERNTEISRAVAIVGRPNVGKSRLFNRLVGRRISIVHDQPGVTRDLITSDVFEGRYTLMDTGGIGLYRAELTPKLIADAVEEQVDFALAAAALVLLVVDASEGCAALDLEVAVKLRQAGKKVIVVANKADTEERDGLMSEFFALGFGEPLLISAEHGRGIPQLQALIIRQLGPELPDDQRLQLRDAAAVLGGDEERLAETEGEELGHQSVAFFGVGLVGDHDDLLAGLTELDGDLQVEGGAPFGSVDHEEHQGGGREGEVDLLLHGVGDELRRELGAIEADAAGIHQRVAAFEDVGRDEVARDARLVVHDRDAAAHQTVEKAALADVGTAHDGYRAGNFSVPFHGTTVGATCPPSKQGCVSDAGGCPGSGRYARRPHGSSRNWSRTKPGRSRRRPRRRPCPGPWPPSAVRGASGRRSSSPCRSK